MRSDNGTRRSARIRDTFAGIGGPKNRASRKLSIESIFPLVGEISILVATAPHNFHYHYWLIIVILGFLVLPAADFKSSCTRHLLSLVLLLPIVLGLNLVALVSTQ